LEEEGLHPLNGEKNGYHKETTSLEIWKGEKVLKYSFRGGKSPYDPCTRFPKRKGKKGDWREGSKKGQQRSCPFFVKNLEKSSSEKEKKGLVEREKSYGSIKWAKAPERPLPSHMSH